MSGINQDIRSGPPNNNPNNPQNLYNYLIVGQTLKGTGAPDNSIGTLNSTYLDTDTGIQYNKIGDGTWENFIDYSGFAPTATVPDPLPIGELQVDLIKGKTSDSFQISGGLTGDIEVILEPTNALNINGGNTTLTGNGNITAGSEIRGFDLIASDGINTTRLRGDQATIEHSGPLPFELKNLQNGGITRISTVNADIELKTFNGDVLLDGPDLDLNGSDIVNNGSGSRIGIFNNSLNQDIQLVTNAGRVTLTGGPLDVGGETIQTVGTISGNSMTVTTTSGNLFLASTGGVADCAGLNNGLVNLSAINGSEASSTNQVLSVDNNGTMAFLPHPISNQFGIQNIGNNGITYLNLGGNTIVGPGEFLCAPVIDAGRRLTAFKALLIYNSPWNWGGVGTAVLEIFTLPTSSPCTSANTSTLTSFPIDVGAAGADYYATYAPTLNIPIPADVKIGVRLLATGTSSTSNTAEMVAVVYMQ